MADDTAKASKSSFGTVADRMRSLRARAAEIRPREGQEPVGEILQALSSLARMAHRDAARFARGGAPAREPDRRPSRFAD